MYKNEAFEMGESFNRVALDIVPDDWPCNDDDDYHWFIPSIVNMAFASELYLKSLLSNGNSDTRGHSLEELFLALPNDMRIRITESPEFKDDEEFHDKLKSHSHIFEDWRYCFEHKKSICIDALFLERFSLSLHDLARESVSAFLDKQA